MIEKKNNVTSIGVDTQGLIYDLLENDFNEKKEQLNENIEMKNSYMKKSNDKQTVV